MGNRLLGVGRGASCFVEMVCIVHLELGLCLGVGRGVGCDDVCQNGDVFGEWEGGLAVFIGTVYIGRLELGLCLGVGRGVGCDDVCQMGDSIYNGVDWGIQ